MSNINKPTPPTGVRLGNLREPVVELAKLIEVSEADVIRQCVNLALPTMRKHMLAMQHEFSTFNSSLGNQGKGVSLPASGLELDATIDQATRRSESKPKQRKPKAASQN